MENKKKVIIKYIIIILIAVLLIIGGIVITKKDEENGKTIEAMQNNNLEIVYDIVVEIKGEVKSPGIYTLPKDTRVQDLITVAGGLTVNADTSSINLASKLSDGMVVVIPKSGSDTSSKTQGKININTATVEELCTLSGIGTSLAQKIVDYRTQNGPFSSIEDIKNVPGIGDALFNKIKDNITI